jgi:amidase
VLEIEGRALSSPIDYLAITFIVSLVGMPCVSIPCPQDSSATPFGVQIVAPPRQEGRLLALARRLERDFGFRSV